MGDAPDGEPWTQVSRFTGRRRGAVLPAGSPAPAAAPYWSAAPAFQAAVTAHLHALASNGPLVGALWRHLCAWQACARAAGAAAPPLLHCVGLGSVSAQGPSGCPLVQLALLLLLARLLQRSSSVGGEAAAAAAAAAAAPLPPAPSAAQLSPEAAAGEVVCSLSSSAISGASSSASSVEATDPCFSAQDVALLASVGVAARCAPWLGPPRGRAALLFMPHCPGVLYTAALAAFAWQGAEAGEGAAAAAAGAQAAEEPAPLPLPCVCIIGNGFHEYVERRRCSVDLRSGAAAEVPQWGPGLRQRIVQGVVEVAAASSSSSSVELKQASQEDRMPPLALDALVAVHGRCQGGSGAWALRCTPLEPLVAPALALTQALSTTAMHSIEIKD